MVTSTQPTTQTLYDQDYYLWIRTTINQLRTGQFSAVDLENLLEELETMGKSEKRAIESLLTKLLVHLLKLKCWDSERERNQGHWLGEIRTFRRQITKSLQDSPSLKPYILEIFDECYQDARELAADETGLPLYAFPKESPFSPEDTLNLDYLPN